MGGGLSHAYFAYLGGVQNLGKPAYIILARSLTQFFYLISSRTLKIGQNSQIDEKVTVWNLVEMESN